MPARRDGIPVLIDEAGGNARRLTRVPFTNRSIQEGHLQHWLLRHPEILPIDDFDPGFGPLVPIGREIETDAGPIDLLYISPNGMVTLVEAKLWRNPEARRHVVGQIIDYAKELRRWGYDELNKRSVAASGKSLWTLVSEASSAPMQLDEPAFIDAVTRNLKAGRFLLLIAGDGIREDMERIAEFLQGTPQLHFTLALVELQVYQWSDGIQLVVPLVVARTTEVTRAVVRVESIGTSQVEVALDLSVVPEPMKGTRERKTLTENEFFADLAARTKDPEATACARQLLDDFGDDNRYFIDWKGSSFVIKLRDPAGSSQVLTLLVVDRNGNVWPWMLPVQLPRLGLRAELGHRFVVDGAKIFGQQVHPIHQGQWEREVPLKELNAKYDQLRHWLQSFGDEVAALSARQEESPGV